MGRRRSSHAVLRWVGPFLMLWMSAIVVQAQIDQGAITGTVSDTAGKAIQGATVTLVNEETGLSFGQHTGNDGSYRFSPIKIGQYSLTFSAPNFETEKRDNIRVDVSQTVGLNVFLKPGSVTESVTVTTTAELQTEDASTGQVFNASQIERSSSGRSQLCVSGSTHDRRQPPEPGQYADIRDRRVFIEWQPRLAKQLYS